MSRNINQSVVSMKMLAPDGYDFNQYEAAIYRKAQQNESKIFDAVFSPDGEYLLACNSRGRISCWRMTTPLLRDDHEKQTPLFTFQAHQAQIYTIAFGGTATDPVLITGADEELRVWKWRDILCLESNPNATINYLHECHHQQARGNRGAMLPRSETNDIAVNSNTHHIFTATGTGSAFEWDLITGKCVQSFGGEGAQRHSDYLHGVAVVSKTNEILTASEDGSIRLWDIRTGQSSRAPNGLNPSSKKISRPWCGSVRVDSSETWMLCCGGNKSSREDAGYFSMWYLPDLTMTTCTTSRVAQVERAIFYESSNEVLTVGNQAQVNYHSTAGCFNRSVRTSVPALYFAAVQPGSNVVVVGGCSPLLDVFLMSGSRSYSLLFED